ncbi:hypothetical protein [Butyrivibrio sp. AC2005]|uniref:hypothetical protein n=1 Tax=Butyrivibrio sp. AC2005 TaxID=1280672 RepID=UPI0012DF0047|nr:hypothetical protein [Butyrivibrio sp. AC2005]
MNALLPICNVVEPSVTQELECILDDIFQFGQCGSLFIYCNPKVRRVVLEMFYSPEPKIMYFPVIMNDFLHKSIPISRERATSRYSSQYNSLQNTLESALHDMHLFRDAMANFSPAYWDYDRFEALGKLPPEVESNFK